MKKLLLTAVIIIALSTPAFSQIDINQDTSDYVKELSGDIGLLPKWQGVLSKEPIIEGAATPDYNALKKVFDSVNGNYIEDSRNYNNFWKRPDELFDYWATPEEFNRKGGGDCEDFAISWYYAARKAGFKASQLNIWIGYLPEKNNLQHAVLAVEVSGKEYVLDNYSNQILNAKDYMHKKFKLMFRLNENGWSTK